MREILRGKSPGRCFLNGAIEQLDIGYPLLDVGGGYQYSYHRRAEIDPDRTVVLNLPREGEIDVAADATRQFPFRDDIFETVLCLNLLEHVYDYETTVAELFRTLAPGGTAAVGVPFLHRIHGDPHDYTRFTEHRLRRLFDRFEDVTVRALDSGPTAAAVVMLWPVFQLDILKYLAWHGATAIDDALHWYNDVLEGTYPLYYVLTAQKPA